LADVPFESNNLLEITATSDYEPIGQCNYGPLLHAELRPSSRLLGGGEPFDAELAEVRAALLRATPLTLEMGSELSLVEVQRMLAILSQVAPNGTSLEYSSTDPIYTAVRSSDLDAAIADATPADFVAWLDADERLVAAPASDLRDGVEIEDIGALAMMIRFDAEDPISAASPQ
jgi:hypothetical protein